MLDFAVDRFGRRNGIHKGIADVFIVFRRHDGIPADRRITARPVGAAVHVPGVKLLMVRGRKAASGQRVRTVIRNLHRLHRSRARTGIEADGNRRAQNDLMAAVRTDHIRGRTREKARKTVRAVIDAVVEGHDSRASRKRHADPRVRAQ